MRYSKRRKRPRPLGPEIAANEHYAPHKHPATPHTPLGPRGEEASTRKERGERRAKEPGQPFVTGAALPVVHSGVRTALSLTQQGVSRPRGLRRIHRIDGLSSPVRGTTFAENGSDLLLH